MSTFPDQELLKQLIQHYRQKAQSSLSTDDELLMLSGVSMNWIADFLTDENAKWERKKIKVNDLVLTGTNPDWNRVIIEQCERSPKKLNQILANQPALRNLFSSATYSDLPILVRVDEGKMKVLDGMHRTIGAILEGREKIEGYICTIVGPAKPHCEPHAVYDLLRSYHRKINQDRNGLIQALRFLRRSYANVDNLLRQRFHKGWVPDDEIQEIIQEALRD